jgi:hypothetical protein
MNIHTQFALQCKRILVMGLSLIVLTGLAAASEASTAPGKSPAAADDGRRDFDWEIGTWHTNVRLLANPLSTSDDEWLQFEGTTKVRSLMDRRANVVEFDVSGPNGHIEALNLRLYEPQAQRWSLTFTNLRDGLLTPSVYGRFQGNVGEFYGDDQLDGRPIKVRFRIVRQGPDLAKFEQAFSADDGKTWETNWIAGDRRVR